MMQFQIFESLSEVHLIERECLSLLNWRVAVDKKDFELYDNAVLKPLQIVLDDAKRPFKKRRSITYCSDEDHHSIPDDVLRIDDVTTASSNVSSSGSPRRILISKAKAWS
jgi:hypothetical protein